MKIVSHLLMICMVFSYALMHATTNPIKKQKEITQSNRGPSIANKFFYTLKGIAGAYLVVGIGVTLFCGYIWLAHDVNNPERMNEMSAKQEKIKQILDQLQTPRDQLRAFPQMLEWGKLEFLKNIDVATAVGAIVTGAASVAYAFFAGAHALTNQ